MKSFLAIFSLIVISHSSYADEISQRKLAEEVLTLTDVSKKTENVLSMVKQMQLNQLSKMNLPAEASEQMKSMQTQMADLVANEFRWEKLKEDYITVYATTFTEQELQGLLNFYRSPAGSAFLKKTPELTKQVMTVAQKQVNELTPKIQELMQRMMEQIKATQKEKLWKSSKQVV